MAKESKIFRYKLSDEIMSTITQFAKVHQFDDRHAYKDAWAQWLNTNQDSVEREVCRLQQLNYNGDVIDKMFKAGRYYFREKVAVAATPVVTTEQKRRRDYIVMAPEIIQAMDQHLHNVMNTKDFKPADAYNQFCDQYVGILRKEIGRLGQHYTGSQLSAKFKKTYKNRYFSLQQH